MSDQRMDPTGDPGHGPATPQPWQPPTMPEDARRMGLDRNVYGGAEIEFASMLDGRKRSHVVVAVLMLLIFALPVPLTLLQVIDLF
jgi:hypothetical protein